VRFVSTRGDGGRTLDDALVDGIAADGGLYVPQELPAFELADFDDAASITEVAGVLLRPFFDGSALLPELSSILVETFSFDIPLKALPSDQGSVSLLELFHGPTAAFKDVGAGFLAACLSRLEGDPDDPLTILVATSGDTGGAVAAAFDGRPGMRVVVLYPDGRVSARQAHQLGCWSDNVLTLKVAGSFDDCQALVKSAMANTELAATYRFSSANSINIGRLLPQSTYYASASLAHFRATGNRPGFIIPTGNLGNALACILARDMGLPIGDIVLATNANRLISDFLAGQEWLPRASLQTLATAMDVGNPSNMERLRRLHGEQESLSALVRAESVCDEQIAGQIRKQYQALGIALCPHTATAFQVYEDLPDAEKERDWILVSTAHAAKFESIVEPQIGEAVPVPEALQSILDKPSRSVTIAPTLDALADALATGFKGD